MEEGGYSLTPTWLGKLASAPGLVLYKVVTTMSSTPMLNLAIFYAINLRPGKLPSGRFRLTGQHIILTTTMLLGAEGSQLGIVGREGRGRELATRKVGDMSGLFNTASSFACSICNTGNNIITNGDTVKVAPGTYECNESG